MNITKRQLIGAGLRSRGQAFDDAADMLASALRSGFRDNPEAIVEQFRAIARTNIESGNDVLTGSRLGTPISGLPTYLPGV
jgi:hypothetical protein